MKFTIHLRFINLISKIILISLLLSQLFCFLVCLQWFKWLRGRVWRFLYLYCNVDLLHIYIIITGDLLLSQLQLWDLDLGARNRWLRSSFVLPGWPVVSLIKRHDVFYHGDSFFIYRLMALELLNHSIRLTGDQSLIFGSKKMHALLAWGGWRFNVLPSVYNWSTRVLMIFYKPVLLSKICGIRSYVDGPGPWGFVGWGRWAGFIARVCN